MSLTSLINLDALERRKENNGPSKGFASLEEKDTNGRPRLIILRLTRRGTARRARTEEANHTRTIGRSTRKRGKSDQLK